CSSAALISVPAAVSSSIGLPIRKLASSNQHRTCLTSFQHSQPWPPPPPPLGTDMSNLTTLALSIGLGVASALPLSAQVDSTWTQPFPPFHIAGNLYYVGTKALASYLVTTPNGLILINSDLEQNVPQIKASIEHLGFTFSDVKILLISHAHFDHDAGSARIKALTGAKYMVMDADVPVVESGGKLDFQYGTYASSLY